MMRRFILTTASLFLFSACGDATATNDPTTKSETKPLTRTECLAEQVNEDKIACMKKLTAQRKIELAQKKARLEETKLRNEQLRKENEALLKEFERGVLDKD